MLLDWANGSDDLRPDSCEVKEKSNMVGSEETQPAAFLSQCLMAKKAILLVAPGVWFCARLLKKGILHHPDLLGVKQGTGVG